ncbi:MAG TPA: hypothetical protein VGD01_09195 [Candidatus Elarobacter sp.]
MKTIPAGVKTRANWSLPQSGHVPSKVSRKPWRTSVTLEQFRHR